MKFSKHADHYSQHISKVMAADNLNWSERVAFAVALIAQAADRDDHRATKADLAAVIAHGLDGLVSKGLMTKEDGSYAFTRFPQPDPEPGKVAVDEEDR